MADKTPLDELLGRAHSVALLASELGRYFQKEHEQQHDLGKIDGATWNHYEPKFQEFCTALLQLRRVMQHPPTAFEPLAEVLLEAARIAKDLRDAMEPPDAKPRVAYLGFFPDLNTVSENLFRAVNEVAESRRTDDPFAFINEPTVADQCGIDTTPTLPKPPNRLIEAAARSIPTVLANVKPRSDGAIEMSASRLTKLMRDEGHTLAAAHWAVHEADCAGLLRASLIGIEFPSFGRRVGGAMRHWGGPDDRRVEWTGSGKGTIGIPKGIPTPFENFKVTATESLWERWRASVADCQKQSEPDVPPFEADKVDQVVIVIDSEPEVAWSDPQTLKARLATETKTEAGTGAPAGPASEAKSPKKSKRSTEKGEGRAKLIAALTKHHKYADGSCLNVEPVGNNELARLAEVSESTASAFFKKKFGEHTKYRAICTDATRLIAALKVLNQEFAPLHLFGSKPPGEDDREDEE